MGKKTEELESQGGMTEVDEVLLKNHFHILHGPIDSENIVEAVKWIVYENLIPRKRNDKTPLTLIISSEGGDLYQSFALIDVMNSSKIPVHTVALGQAMSAGFLIFINGKSRLVGRYTSLMCHEYSVGTEAKHHDLKAMIDEGDQCMHRMEQLIRTKIRDDDHLVRSLIQTTDVYLTAEQAIQMGIADGYYE